MSFYNTTSLILNKNNNIELFQVYMQADPRYVHGEPVLTVAATSSSPAIREATPSLAPATWLSSYTTAKSAVCTIFDKP